MTRPFPGNESPAEVYSFCPYRGLPEPHRPFDDKAAIVTKLGPPLSVSEYFGYIDLEE